MSPLDAARRSMDPAVFRTESEEAAHGIMREDPAVRENVMHAELHP